MKEYLITFFVSMVPLIELRGAIPYSQVVGLPLLPAYIISIVGNMIPVPIIFFFARKVLLFPTVLCYDYTGILFCGSVPVLLCYAGAF